jgi:hypothetical protein
MTNSYKSHKVAAQAPESQPLKMKPFTAALALVAALAVANLPSLARAGAAVAVPGPAAAAPAVLSNAVVRWIYVAQNVSPSDNLPR